MEDLVSKLTVKTPDGNRQPNDKTVAAMALGLSGIIEFYAQFDQGTKAQLEATPFTSDGSINFDEVATVLGVLLAGASLWMLGQ